MLHLPRTVTRRRPLLTLAAATVVFFALTGLIHSQTTTPATAPTQHPPDTSATNQEQTPPRDADGKIVTAPEHPKTKAELQDQAWSMLSTAVVDTKRPETQIQALAALGQMGGTPRSLDMIRTAMTDKDVDVRVAAALASAQTRSPNITTDLRRMLDDKEPAAAFAAAVSLWKMHDRSGEDILTAVADGDRKTVPGLVHGTEHDIDKELHDPSGVARFGAMQGAYLLLGPFGYGLTAFEYIHKNGGDSARVTAVELIAQNHTAPIRRELISATTDKDLGVRAAACKALARYHNPDVGPAIANVFYDNKPPVRLTAAAAYLTSTGAAQVSPIEGENADHPTKH
jgi:HEAT repeat protein